MLPQDSECNSEIAHAVTVSLKPQDLPKKTEPSIYQLNENSPFSLKLKQGRAAETSAAGTDRQLTA